MGQLLLTTHSEFRFRFIIASVSEMSGTNASGVMVGYCPGVDPGTNGTTCLLTAHERPGEDEGSHKKGGWLPILLLLLKQSNVRRSYKLGFERIH
jgi:hypothetical protein